MKKEKISIFVINNDSYQKRVNKQKNKKELKITIKYDKNIIKYNFNHLERIVHFLENEKNCFRIV